MYFKSLQNALKGWHVWIVLAISDIKMSYQRSLLGPLWLTLTMALRIYLMGFLYSQLLNHDLKHYLPYLGAGMICWELINKYISEGPLVFIDADMVLKNFPISPTVHVLRMMTRNMFIFLHYLLAYIPIFFIFHVPINMNLLLIFPGMMIIIVNAVMYCSILGMVGVRFRDIPPIIDSIMRIAFFVTPVLWMPNRLTGKMGILVHWNPLGQFLDLLRRPLMGQPFLGQQMKVVGIMTFIGFIIYSFVYIRKEYRIVFWA